MNETKEQSENLTLRDQTKDRLIFGRDYAKQIAAPGMANLMDACLEKFDDIAELIDWNSPRTNGELNSVYGSLAAAIQYAWLKSGVKFSPEEFFRERSSHDWSEIIDSLLMDNNSKQELAKNVWRPPMVVIPQRAIALQYILPFLFDNKEINGVDLGAGLHVALPMINSEDFLTADFPDKNAVVQNAKPKVNLGLGVDLQDRDLLWCQASLWPLPINASNFKFLCRCYERAQAEPQRSPFLKANVLEDISRIKEITNGQVDFVFSSYIRSQLGTDPATQKRFIETISDLLSEEGIWVDIGEELLEEGEKPTKWGVNVYRKQHDGSLIKIGTPFFLGSNQRDILEVDKAFFKVP